MVTLAEAAVLLQQPEVRDADFTGLDLRSVWSARSEPRVFRACVFRDACLAARDLTGATFEGGVFDEADFGGAKLADSVWLGVAGNRFQAARALATGARFERCSLVGADLSECDLGNAVFKSTRLTGGSLAKARLRNARFDDCHLVAVDLRGVSLYKQTLHHVDLSEANLSGADLRDVVLQGCRLRGARLVDARFAGADLREADLGVLTPASCGALRGATISTQQAADLVRGLGLNVL